MLSPYLICTEVGIQCDQYDHHFEDLLLLFQRCCSAISGDTIHSIRDDPRDASTVKHKHKVDTSKFKPHVDVSDDLFKRRVEEGQLLISLNSPTPEFLKIPECFFHFVLLFSPLHLLCSPQSVTSEQPPPS